MRTNIFSGIIPSYRSFFGSMLNVRYLRLCLITFLFVGLSGCHSMTAVTHIPKSDNTLPINLAVFLDGTANSEASYTNISKLHNLMTLQDAPLLRTSYIKGVGTDGRVLGMALGFGIGHDVREAYLFLAENYDHRRGDTVYLFGFSEAHLQRVYSLQCFMWQDYLILAKYLKASATNTLLKFMTLIKV
ncbi:hypothetical protein CS022_02105 [Veronia nyctiphanis]|uniref:T6SS Phospholipase effector Tle1-like catalytic domain-containing protein n=1 Tax=Veronia nyctiphanis TaxID=1278244 RepID=A0A4Q0YUG4_9GAMM|nr:hypothetical protein CS022_02105 [Veronia nyctiphanis]